MDQSWQVFDSAKTVVNCYIYASAQRAQLESGGFELVEALDMTVRPFDYCTPPADWMAQFLCRHKAHE
jgi:hypothetical protein